MGVKQYSEMMRCSDRQKWQLPSHCPHVTQRTPQPLSYVVGLHSSRQQNGLLNRAVVIRDEVNPRQQLAGVRRRGGGLGG